MALDAYFVAVLRRLEAMYHEMHGAIAAPVLVNDGVYPRFRYEVLTDSHACFLKGVKVISTLNASMVLLKHGHVQEIGALCRMVDDFCNEVFFLLVPQAGEKVSDDQMQFLENFFQEELDHPRDPLGSTQKRETVSTRKIHATFARLAKSEVNPSDAQEMLRTTHQAFSGYIHGAYPHIMEMYGGNPPHFHLSGMPAEAPIVDGWRKHLVGYMHQLIMISIFVARKLALPNMETPLRALMAEFEEKTGSAPKKKADEMLKDLKKNAI